jgi:hypothetical protein
MMNAKQIEEALYGIARASGNASQVQAMVGALIAQIQSEQPSDCTPPTDEQIEAMAREDAGGDAVDWTMPENLGATAVQRAAFRRGARAAIALGVKGRGEPEPQPWVPYLSDRADGVRGHYAICRWNPHGYREAWNLRSHCWASCSDEVLTLEHARKLLAGLTVPPTAQAGDATNAADGVKVPDAPLPYQRAVLDALDSPEPVSVRIAGVALPRADQQENTP